MYMSESLFNDAARSLSGGLGSNTILMIAECDLFSECLAEVLSRKFPEWDVLLHGGDTSGEDEGNARLIILYRIAPGALPGIVERIRKTNHTASVAIVADGSQILDDRYVRELVEAREIEGILPVNLRLDVFLAAVDLLAKGGEHFPSALLQRLRHSETSRQANRYDPSFNQAARFDGAMSRPGSDGMGLTTREVQILNMLCEGTQNKNIADRLNLSENTVKVHIRNIYKKMHVRNRTEAASRFFNADRMAPQPNRGH
ncbi:helix-turn-helix transcriptional regulator [Allorhizobium borbori]|uniref:helix-turn-helix transcriptional regulator n=1 Tax=Allorhizobium borbori TaxID=485907 RepID=UPI00161C2821|nr:response regulator transcription factor [Allorhizobium borbori]